ncbi:hypothetical protein [Sinomonas halotolerans]|uniref:Secreted protein n=1 Tax=Sinomonas halotolerans TaxID=1644133 RepID=A0ABU9WW83_9MICC
MFRKTLATLGVAAALTFIAAPAQALHCVNESRPAYTGTDYQFVPGPNFHVHIEGNWAFIQEYGVWVFVPPGTVPLTPGAHGNFQNGGADALLENSAVCDPSGVAFSKRQTDNGIQWCQSAP